MTGAEGIQEEGLNAPSTRGTSTSSFGTGKREGHDASAFYERFSAPEISDDQTVNANTGLIATTCFVGSSVDMHQLADNSVALVVTSPPYFVGKDYELAVAAGARDNNATVPAGPTAIAGVGWAGHRSVDRVEVRIDEGDWIEATLSGELSEDSWRQWMISWDATPGNHVVQVRATDGENATQTAERTAPAPDGATGHHTIGVRVV